MISVDEATRQVLATARALPPETVPLPLAVGRVLLEPLYADRDFPPFHRVAMDGIALAFKAVAAGQTAFPIAATQLAGMPPQPLLDEHAAVEIMTGAALPPGTDTVVRYEDLEFQEVNGRRVAALLVPPPAAGHNIHHQAADRQQGDLLLPAGTRLSPAEIAVAATIGAATLRVARPLRVAVVSTGDELVELEQIPLAHQIRRSNAYMVQAALQQAGAESDAFHFNDDQQALRQGLPPLLAAYDALVLSGGVSKGQADFLPAMLQELGVTQLFHEVHQRPGKPFWFGEKADGAVVFALPGNPVSTFVNFYQYVLPWLRRCQQPHGQPQKLTALLATDFSFAPRIAYFLPVRLETAPYGHLLAHPQAIGGSGDLASLLHCDGFLRLPPEPTEFKAGDAFPLVRFR
ncbi:molybdopterin molybdotransferase MoeA [Hymenobacter aquaticus]|uniref:Molybdopterin molybdenumtransferase n=1 Tax=Hymenobacter aquaticus TaxID=1867101 RepID=A0A4Z0PU98_9BACT|nr:molybdopterin molybdotransferase MoeA [Hymenobacter aquaticus]TGE21360.1 molybdopterin molybdotransferase MoeA [Hymenobacter aquaticus]